MHPASACSSAASSPSSSYLYLPGPLLSMQSTRQPGSSPTASTPSTPPASIAALPSLAHSLSSFPTMTTVTKDMVHYGTSRQQREVSEAKLNEALLRSKQRQPVSPPQSPGRTTRRPDEDDESPLMMTPRKRKVKNASS
ncbi:uncharacterized protein C8Q71DRAFT_303408 [Rhodofomes roseus]|uniref:Uncharacterized protein n=1 Tax=Rhodofomes roseus TaxID=34475 RepID=A0ABQ8K3I0_9APHY|nr:uncharacterized protein C8Q71DRAFT_303408 [Rhodofomes roseus]KAH9831431.1 hypothetical protein C8Q71DRAFT_303408 [Rhodofomes roseus]